MNRLRRNSVELKTRFAEGVTILGFRPYNSRYQLAIVQSIRDPSERFTFEIPIRSVAVVGDQWKLGLDANGFYELEKIIVPTAIESAATEK